MRSEKMTLVPSGETSRSRTAPWPLVMGNVTFTSGVAALAVLRMYRSLPVIEVMRSRASMSAGVADLSCLLVLFVSTGCFTYIIG